MRAIQNAPHTLELQIQLLDVATGTKLRTYQSLAKLCHKQRYTCILGNFFNEAINWGFNVNVTYTKLVAIPLHELRYLVFGKCDLHLWSL